MTLARNEDKRFVMAEQQSGFVSGYGVLVDRKTGVNYLVVNGSNGMSGVTPLLDKDGKVVVSTASELMELQYK